MKKINQNQEVSIFQNFTKIIGRKTIPQIIQEIKKGTHKKAITQIRTAIRTGQEEKASQLKKQLLAFTASGLFKNGRTMDCLEEYHPMIILDIDHLELEALQVCFTKIKIITYTHAAFISPSGKGIKILVKTNSTQSQHRDAFQQVAKFYETELKIKVDQSGKDITRLCFMSYDPSAILNLESKTFTLNAVSIQESPSTAQVNIYRQTLENCVAKTNNKLSFKSGNRNNYIYQLALNCSQTGIPMEVTDSFCKSTFDYSNKEMTSTIKSAYCEKKKPALPASTIELPKETPGSMSQKIFDELPLLLKEGCAGFNDPRQRDVFLTGALGVLSGCLPGVQGIYDGDTLFPNLYTFVIAPAASGKGALKYSRSLGMSYHDELLTKSVEAQKEHQLEVQRYEFALGQYRKGKLPEAPIAPELPPFKTLFIPANSSSAMLIRQLHSNVDGGILFESEADTLGNVLKQDWGGYSDLMRKAFHHEPISYSRKSNAQFIEILDPKLSIVLSGTPNQVASLIQSAEDGLFSRFLFYVFESEINWRDVSPKGRKQNFQLFFKQKSSEVLAMVRFLKKHKTVVHLSEEQWATINETFLESLMVTYQLRGPEATSIVRRLGAILFRLTMIFSALRKFEQQDTADVVYCLDQDFETALSLVEHYKKHAVFLFDRLPKQSSSFQFKNVRKQAFYGALPERFSKQEALLVAQQLSIPNRTVNRYLNQLLALGYLSRPESDPIGGYEKVTKS